MNAIDVLKNDHRKVEQLFADFLNNRNAADERERVFQQIHIELSAHTEAEEKVFYPALAAEIPGVIDRALEEHMELKELLATLNGIEFDGEAFDTIFTDMMEAVQAHVDEEEREGGIMEVASQTLSKDLLASMATDIKAIKEQVQGEMAA